MGPKTKEAAEQSCSASTFGSECLTTLDANDPSVFCNLDHCEVTCCILMAAFHVRPVTFHVGA